MSQLAPLDQSLADGLGAMGGGAPAPAPVPAAEPQKPPSLVDLYVKARTMGMDDTNAALAVAQHMRQQADLRSSLREAAAITAGRTYDPNDRAQLMAEADKPLQDLAQRRAVPQIAAEDTERQQKLIGGDIALRQQVGLMDPGHPTNVAMRSAFTKLGLTPPANLTVAALPKEMWDTVKPLAEMEQKRSEIAALAPGRAAEAAKNRAEATKIGGPDTAKTSAEAAKAAAEAGVEAQKLGSSPAPGYERTGQVPYEEKTNLELQNRDASQKVINRNVDEVLKTLGDRDLILDPKKRAQVAAPLGKLMLKLKDEAASRGLPDSELKLFGDILGDPRQFTVANAASLSHIKDRLQSFKATASQDHDSWVSSHGFRKVGGSGDAGQTVDVISPSGQRGKIPAANLDKALKKGFKRADASPNA